MNFTCRCFRRRCPESGIPAARISRLTIIIPSLLLILAPAVAPAQFLTSTQNNAITITGYSGTALTVTIPPTMGPLPVTMIGPQAFMNNNTITDVTIAASVSIIASNAFAGCASLASVTFPGPGLTTIGDYAFAYDQTLSSFTLPSSETSMGQYVFYGDYGLTSFNIQSGATTLGPYALCSCFLLPSLSLPSSMVNIGNDAFLACYGLSSITVDPANPSFKSLGGVLFNNSMTTLVQYPPVSSVTSYSVPAGVTTLADGAFQGSGSLTQIILPQGLTMIGQYAFFGAEIENLGIPKSVNSIGTHAFSGSALTNLCLPCGIASIPDNLCYNCQDLIAVEIPRSVTSIGEESFAFCPDLGRIRIPGNVATIGDLAFYDTGVTSVKLENGLTSIGSFAFYECNNLMNVVIPGSVTSLGNDAFASCPGLAGVYFGGSVPTGISLAFDGDNPTFYYLPESAGWDALSGFPKISWNPKIEYNANFGLRGGQFGFDISGNNNLTVGVDASTSLTAPRWRSLSTLTLTGGSAHFSDPDWSLHSTRFYRVDFPY